MKVKDLIKMLERADPDKLVAVGDMYGAINAAESIGTVGNDVVIYPL